jgi:hypothetical protein
MTPPPGAISPLILLGLVGGLICMGMSMGIRLIGLILKALIAQDTNNVMTNCKSVSDVKNKHLKSLRYAMDASV